MSNNSSTNNTRNKSRAKYPEIRDYLIDELGIREEAERVGFNRLPTRVVGTIGGLTNKAFVELAKRDLASNPENVSQLEMKREAFRNANETHSQGNDNFPKLS